MNFLLDTDTCSAHLKRPAGLMHRFVQHAGGLCISTIVLGELYTWAYNRKNWAEAVQRIENDLLPDVIVLDFDSACANQFGTVRAQLLQVGISVSRLDLLIASVALVHNLTLVTHNTADYSEYPWLATGRLARPVSWPCGAVSVWGWECLLGTCPVFL